MSYTNTNFTNIAQLKKLAQRTDAIGDRVTVLENVGAQANVLEGVKVNGVALSIAEKIVDILIATGETNGTIKVNGADVSVAGLAALAYKSKVSADDLADALTQAINAKAEASDLTTLAGKVDVLVGSVEGDGSKSVRTISAEEVAKIVASAPEDFDTLKEISDWIENHADDAAAMNSAITALQNKLVLGTHEVGGEQVEYATVKAYVEAVTGSFIALTALSTEDSGTGNVVTGVSYSSATGKFTITKGMMVAPVTPTAAGNIPTLTAAGQLADSGIKAATDAEVDEMLAEVFGDNA